jgi:hypothetical protein
MRPQTGTRREIVEQWKHRLPDSAADIFFCDGCLDRKAGVVVRFDHPRRRDFLVRCSLLLEGNSDET